MRGSSESPIPRLDACCGCIQLKIGVLILCVLQMIASGLMMLTIGMYVVFGTMAANETVPMLGGAFTLFSMIIVFMLTLAEFGFALWAFIDIQRAEPTGLRYYYMFKVLSLLLSLLLFILTSYWTSPEILNLFISSIVSLYCIWCIWSLHEAMMLGGEAAVKAGFSADELGGHEPLIGDSGGDSARQV